jgi:type I restriction enzyme S subunit
MPSKPQFVGEKVKLGELISKANAERCGDRSFPVYSMTMHDGIVEQSGRFKKAIASKDTSSYKIVRKNQLVVGFPIDEGVIYVQNHEQAGIMSPAYNVWDFDSSRVIPAYLELALHGPQSMAYYAEKMRGTTARRRSLTADGLRALPIVLPSIERQSAVVEVLKGIKGQLAETQKIADGLDSLVKSRFVEMFGDPIENPKSLPIKRIDQIADVQTGATPLRSKSEYYGGPIPWVKTGEVASGLHGAAEETITELALRETNCKLFPAGTILVAMYGQGDTRGKAAILKEAAATNQACAAIILKDGYDADFILAQLNLRYEDLRALSLGGNQKNLSLKIIKGYELVIPSIDQQCAFMSFVAEVDKSRFVAQQQIEKLQMLYDSLAQEYFGD